MELEAGHGLLHSDDVDERELVRERKPRSS
jgi:hypothetical protein